MATKKQTEEKNVTITIQPLNLKLVIVTIKSLDGSTYIPHRRSVEMVKDIVGREFGDTKKKKLRNIDAEYESCFYYTRDGKYGIPSSAFMASIMDAAIACNIPKTHIKRAIRIGGDICELRYKEVNRREDTVVRSGISKSPDLRVRPEFIDWETDLLIQFDANQISVDQIHNLINQAGFSSGVGDWRPSSPKSSGTHGMYEVKV